MKCIYCGYRESKVVDSRATEEINSIRRRRECLNCGRRFTTYETVETAPILVVKADGSRQPFDPSKIKKGVIKACEKRPISIEQIDNIVDEIEKQICSTMTGEVSSKAIGEMIIEKLKNLDEIAYVRFACVYKKFEDASQLKQFIDKK